MNCRWEIPPQSEKVNFSEELKNIVFGISSGSCCTQSKEHFTDPGTIFCFDKRVFRARARVPHCVREFVRRTLTLNVISQG